MDFDFEKLMEESRQQRQEGIKEAKAALFAYLERFPQVARITACYSGSGDEGWVDDVRYFGTGGDRIDLDDKRLSGLVDELFQYVTPDGFEINEGGDGEIHVYAAAQEVVVEHNQNVVYQESETYEV
jgi:hypothetical protein